MRYFYCYTTQTVVYLYSTVVRFLIWSRIAINVNIVFVTLPVPSRGKKKKLLRNRKQKMLDQLINYTEETIFRNSRNGRLEHRYMSFTRGRSSLFTLLDRSNTAAAATTVFSSLLARRWYVFPKWWRTAARYENYFLKFCFLFVLFENKKYRSRPLLPAVRTVV